ncbi:NADH dehydrogenase [ubiquinone] 1 alpha subcomplex subunit 2-like [Macrobrachium nipponense]|uniref:NADH dehydrogenase [ubiquinone] 1 alpha subcomplex subunit 2-like n=1 Tax=Macrobrachium nipponense TaxID=159736 RepID=UPI0030C86731
MAARAAVKFAPQLRELRIHLCQRSAASQGVREFIEQSYVSLKQANPKSPILIRECSGVQPKIWARYDMGQETCVSVAGQSASEVASAVEKLVT